jgi:Rod binding domain-containing protein
MDNVNRIPPAGTPLTADQQAKLQKLHDAATQLEGVFVGMLFKEMRKSAPETSIFGKVDQAEKNFEDMLDEKRADLLAKSGQLGIAKIVEQQLRASVLGSPGGAAGAGPAAGPIAGSAAAPVVGPALPPEAEDPL